MAGYDPIPMLENAGYTEQEAAFLYLVAIHSGYFLRRQFSRFVRRDRGGLADKFIQKALRLDHLQVIECGQARHVYHLTSRPVYQTVFRSDSQHRRFKGFAYMQSRLLILDFVLDNLSDAILEDEAATVCPPPPQRASLSVALLLRRLDWHKRSVRYFSRSRR